MRLVHFSKFLQKGLLGLLALAGIVLLAGLVPSASFVIDSTSAKSEILSPVEPGSGVRQRIGTLASPVVKAHILMAAGEGGKPVRVNASLVPTGSSIPIRQFSLEVGPHKKPMPHELRFHPYEPGLDEVLELELAVSPGASNYVSFGIARGDGQRGPPTVNGKAMTFRGPLAYELIGSRSGLKAGLQGSGPEFVRMTGGLALLLVALAWAGGTSRRVHAIWAAVKRNAAALAMMLVQWLTRVLRSLLRSFLRFCLDLIRFCLKLTPMAGRALTETQAALGEYQAALRVRVAALRVRVAALRVRVAALRVRVDETLQPLRNKLSALGPAIAFTRHPWVKTSGYTAIILAVATIAWVNVLNFWFFKAFAPSWFMSGTHTIHGLLQTHGFLYLISYNIFGWNPSGWYAVALVLHIIAALLGFWLVAALTGRTFPAFLAALIFVASGTYHDVLTWGSFNSHYPLLLILVLLTVLLYHYYRQSKRRFIYVASLATAILAYFTRETGLTLLAVIPAYELLFGQPRPSRVYAIAFIKRILPYFLLAFVFLIIRDSYGGVPGDFNDESVQMRTSLMADGLYPELSIRIANTFGRLVASSIWPYTLLNPLRASAIEMAITGRANFEAVNLYLFTVIGWATVPLLLGIAWLARKGPYSKVILFGLVWAALNTFLVAVAIPATDNVLGMDYSWNTRRYNYHSYFGIAIFISLVICSLYTWINRTKRWSKLGVPITATLIAAMVTGNILWLKGIQTSLQHSTYQDPRNFYAAFAAYHPTMPTDYMIYHYPHASPLADYLFEWSFLKADIYPNLKDQPYRQQTNMEVLIRSLARGEQSLWSTFFFDYRSDVGLIDRTWEGREVVMRSTEVAARETAILELPRRQFPVEVPYVVEAKLRARPTGPPSADAESQALRLYAEERHQFLVHTKVSVLRSIKPDTIFSPSNLVDGNFGRRSTWIADSWPAVVTLDLGRTKDVRALLWTSAENSIRVPSSYTISLSGDGKVWYQVFKMSRNESSRRIDTLERAYSARFVRMEVATTTGGAFAELDELEVIGDEAAAVLDYYTDVDKLLEASQQVRGLHLGWGFLTWETTSASPFRAPQSKLFLIATDNEWQTVRIKIPEWEFLSGKEEFLEKFINQVQIEAGPAITIEVDYIKLSPAYKIGSNT